MLRTESRRQQLAVSTGLRVSTAKKQNKKKQPTSSAYRLGKRKTICSLWYNYKRRSRLATDATQSFFFFTFNFVFSLSRLFRVNVVCSYFILFFVRFVFLMFVLFSWPETGSKVHMLHELASSRSRIESLFTNKTWHGPYIAGMTRETTRKTPSCWGCMCKWIPSDRDKKHSLSSWWGIVFFYKNNLRLGSRNENRPSPTRSFSFLPVSKEKRRNSPISVLM